MVARRLLGGDFVGGRKPYCFLLISNFNGIPSRSLSGEEISRRNTEELRSFKGLFT